MFKFVERRWFKMLDFWVSFGYAIVFAINWPLGTYYKVYVISPLVFVLMIAMFIQSLYIVHRNYNELW